MLEEHLDPFSTDDTDISLSIGMNLLTENPVVAEINAHADRLDDGGERVVQAASLRGALTDVRDYNRRAVLGWMDGVRAGLVGLGEAAYKLPEADWSSHIFAIETVEAHETERGRGLSLFLLGAALEQLSAGRSIIAVLEACPFYPERMTPADQRAARAKLRTHWSKLGFERVSPRSKYMAMAITDYDFPEELLVEDWRGTGSPHTNRA